MSNIKKPAFSGIFPVEVNWKSPSKKEFKVLQDSLDLKSISSIQKKYDSSSKFLVGYYKLITDKSYFFKVVGDSDSKNQLNGELISKWLAKAGVSVNSALPNYPKKIKQHNLWVFLYEYIEHEFFDGSEQSIYCIGKELGKMHKVMKNYPQLEKIHKKGVSKNQFLAKQLEDIKNGLIYPAFSTNAINIIKNTSNIEFLSITKNSQVIHGDMNFGNIIFKKESRTPIIIDFEDTSSAWMSPLYDIAFIIQRFILQYQVTDKSKLTSLLIDGYKSQVKLSNIINKGSLYAALKMISIRSLLLISTLNLNEQNQLETEVSKFVDLYYYAQRNKLLISNLEQILENK
jgi:fructosamine-3-kinase